MSAPTLDLPPEQISAIITRWQSLDDLFANALRSGIPPAQALVRLGIHLCMHERYDDSLLVLRAAVASSPHEPDYLNNLAVVLERSGRTAEAIPIAEHSLALRHAQPDSWIFLGNMKRAQADLPGAQTAFETARALDPNAPLAWQGLGLIHQQQRRHRAALDCFITCIKLSGPTAPLLAILGQLFYQTGQFEKSRDAYAAAIDYDPANPVYRRMQREMQFLCAAIADTPLEEALRIYAQNQPATPTADDKDIPQLLQSTFSLLSAFGHEDAARRIGALRLALCPTSATAAYLLQALNGATSLPRSPDAYLREYFDAFAARFDEHLVGTLGYDIPAQLAAALIPCLPARPRLHTLDAGCGTGLCGPTIRPFSAKLTGVDLSPAMLDRARQRLLYDRLICSELTTYLCHRAGKEGGGEGGFDLIIAADVLIYFGDLAALAAAFAQALRPGGLCAFSTERPPLSAPSGHQLLPSGRFAHDPAYILATFQSHFAPRHTSETTIRLEACRPVPGNIYIFQRP